MFLDRKLPPLSIISYYGGKYQMCYQIADMLKKYENDGVDTYVELFGGGARVLLNKPRHKFEYYGELMQGMNTLFKVLADKKKADKFISYLFDIEVSENLFYECKLYKDYYEDLFFDFKVKETAYFIEKAIKNTDKNKIKSKFVRIAKSFLTYKVFLDAMNKYYNSKVKFNEFIKSKFNKINIPYNTDIEQNIDILTDIISTMYDIVFEELDFGLENSKTRFNKIIDDWLIDDLDLRYQEEQTVNKNDMKYPHLKLIDDEDIQLAVATYFVYLLSRNALGVRWGAKGAAYANKRDMYEKRVSKLTDVIERLDGVHILGSIPAEFMINKKIAINSEDTYIDFGYLDMFDKPNVCMYLDPPYLRENGDTEEYNPSIHYKTLYTVESHKNLLKKVRMLNCNIIISNYDDKFHLYKRYLEDGEELSMKEKKTFKPFKRREVPAITNLNNNGKIQRTEVLWYRYV